MEGDKSAHCLSRLLDWSLNGILNAWFHHKLKTYQTHGTTEITSCFSGGNFLAPSKTRRAQSYLSRPFCSELAPRPRALIPRLGCWFLSTFPTIGASLSLPRERSRIQEAPVLPLLPQPLPLSRGGISRQLQPAYEQDIMNRKRSMEHNS